MSTPERPQHRLERPPRRNPVYLTLGLWHTLAFLGFVLAPLFERRVPWYMVFAHAAGAAISPPLLVIFVVPVTLFLLRVFTARRRQEPLLDGRFLARRSRGLGAGCGLLGLGTAAWLTTLVVAVAQRWPQGIGIGIGIAVLLSGTGILTIEISERRWRSSLRGAATGR
jgi:hypothetical protein